MIVVFVVDTSPSMGKPVRKPNNNSSNGNGNSNRNNNTNSSSSSRSSSSSSNNNNNMLSRLDLAKMAVEDLTKALTRRIHDHNTFLQQQPPAVQKAMCNIGLGYQSNNQYLLLSTSRQHLDRPGTVACGAGGRLLVGYGPDNIYSSSNSNNNNSSSGTLDCGTGNPLIQHDSGSGGSGPTMMQSPSTNSSTPATNNNNSSSSTNTASFHKELKQLQASVWDPNSVPPGKSGTAAAAAGGGGANSNKGFPEDCGGAEGLNAALSAGLQLLSRYRLHDRSTENFGMGRLPHTAMMTTSSTTTATASTPNNCVPAYRALQPACLILLTDGACLRKSPAEGGGPLQLQYGTMPLREFYKEPFRWDQRVICLGIGGGQNSGDTKEVTSTQYLHPHLRALCEVTGGHHTMVRSPGSLPAMTDRLLRILAPPLPRELPLPDPLKSPVTATNSITMATTSPNGSSSFVNGGPVCCFKALEGDADAAAAGGKAQTSTVYRAMILYVPTPTPQLTPTDIPESVTFSSPLWCIPENFFPRKTLDTLPPRPAQPMLMISRFPSKLTDTSNNSNNKSFEPNVLMKQLHRLDQLILSTKQLLQSSFSSSQQQQAHQSQVPPAAIVRMLHRDVYICEWISVDDKPPKVPQPNTHGGSEYFPVMVQDAGRPSADDAGGGTYLNIGILHAPVSTSTLASSNTMSASSRPFSTLTLLPPDPQILVPLLLKAVEAEHKAIKVAVQANNSADALATASRMVQIDEAWKQDFRHYIARLPPYYQTPMKRALRSVLPTGFHPILATTFTNEFSVGPGGAGGGDSALSSSSPYSSSSLHMQCFSKACFQKIRNAEQIAREANERLERQEAELRGVSKPIIMEPQQQNQPRQPSFGGRTQLHRNTNDVIQGEHFEVGYGQYDPRSSTESYLSALRTLPAPWLVGANSSSRSKRVADAASIASSINKAENSHSTEKAGNERRRNVMECLGDLPANCLMAYYESRRRWLFGGTGLTTRGLMVEGVNNDGSNAHRCGANPNEYDDQSLLSLAGVGVSTLNETTVAKMGDYRERLLWSRSPVVGSGSNDSCGVAATTAQDGSPRWSVDDDAMPMSFFDPKTGEFADSVQTRLRSRLMVNFGNAYKDKRADSLVPDEYLNQCPSSHQHASVIGDSPQHGSPPHDSYSSSFEEGEALFTKPPPPKSPPHSTSISLSRPPAARTHKRDDANMSTTDSGHTDADDASSMASSSSADATPPPPTKKLKTEADFESSPKPFIKSAHTRRQEKESKPPSVPSTPTTPSAPSKVKSSPGGTPAGVSPKPPPPPMSPKTTPGLPPKARPPPPPPGGKKPPPPPSLDKRPSFQLAPSKPLPNIPTKRPASNLGQPPPPPSASSDSGKTVPAPPSFPKTSKLEEKTSSEASNASAPPSSTAGKKKPPPPPPVMKRPRSNSSDSAASGASAEQPVPTKVVQAQQPPPLQAPTQPLDYTNKDRKPNVDLPTGWMCVWSKSQTRWYFFDTRSNKSVWEWPPPS